MDVIDDRLVLRVQLRAEKADFEMMGQKKWRHGSKPGEFPVA